MMKRLLIAAVFLPVLVAGQAFAEPPALPKIAVVDIDVLSEKSKATQSLAAQIEAETAAFRAQMAFKYEALQDELRSLRVRSASLPPEQQMNRQAALAERVGAIQAQEAAGIAAIEARGEVAFAALQGGFRDVVGFIGASLEVDMILQASAYQALVAEGLAAAGAEDVTSLVLILLDEK